MPTRRCCCNAGCFVFQDDFNRTDSTDLGANWDEDSGDWGITDGELVEEYLGTTGTGGAQVFCTRPVPASSAGEMHIRIEVPLESVESGDKYYIWPCCPDTSTEGTVEVEFSYDGTNWTTTITGGPGSAGATYTVPLTGTPTHVVLIVCADHENELVSARVSPTLNEYGAWEDVDPGTGRYSAIGHDNTAHQNCFDNFSLEELRTPTELCRDCFCVCDNSTVPPHLIATIVNAEDRALCLEGKSWAMDFVLAPQQVQWEGGLVEGDDELNFRLTCGEGYAGGFNLIPLAPFNCHNTNIQKSADVDLSTCDPLALYFGPYVLSFPMDCSLCYEMNQPGCTGMPPPPDDCSGVFWIVITEAP